MLAENGLNNRQAQAGAVNYCAAALSHPEEFLNKCAWSAGAAPRPFTHR